jgi:hypothetical protein
VFAPPAPAHVLEAVRDAPAWKAAQPFERQRRSRAIATESFPTEVVACLDPHARVQVEAVAFDGERRLVGSIVGLKEPKRCTKLIEPH